jgi:TupA-like ATPgrasp
MSGRRRLRAWRRIIRKLRRTYQNDVGPSPRFFRPRRFTEKMQWRKLFDLDPMFTVFSDKVAVRKYIADCVGSDALVPLLWLGSDPAAIPFDRLRPPYIIKCTHGSGWNITVRDERALDRDAVRATLATWLATDYGSWSMEPGYCAVPRGLLVEPLLTYRGGYLPEYRFFMFDGALRRVMQSHRHGDGGDDRTQSYYDPQWRNLRVRQADKPWGEPAARPEGFATMLAMAERLAGRRDFVRVDFLVGDEKIYVGELTLYHRSGLFRFDPDEEDLALGACWRLRRPFWRACRTIIARDWGVLDGGT